MKTKLTSKEVELLWGIMIDVQYKDESKRFNKHERELAQKLEQVLENCEEITIEG